MPLRTLTRLGPDARRGHLAMLTFSALVAGSFSLGSMAAPLIDPGALTAARFALSGALVGLLAWHRGGLTRAALSAPWRYGVLGGLLATYFVLMFIGLQTAPPISAATVFTLTPLMAAGFGWLVLRQRVTGQIAVALALGALGAIWVIFRGDPSALLTLTLGRGEAVYLLGCAAHALYAPLVRKTNRGETALASTFLTMLAGWILLTLWSWEAVGQTRWTSLPGIVWLALIYLAIAASAASFVLLQYASLRLPSAKVLAYTYLTPGWVVLWELALGHATPPAITLAGLVLIGAALWLLLDDQADFPPGTRPSSS